MAQSRCGDLSGSAASTTSSSSAVSFSRRWPAEHRGQDVSRRSRPGLRHLGRSGATRHDPAGASLSIRSPFHRVGISSPVLDPRCTLLLLRGRGRAPGLAQLRAGLTRNQIIWGGIPSVALLPDSMSDDEFEAYLDGLSERLGDGRRLILSVCDNVPVEAPLDRVRRIGEWIDALGPVPLGTSAS
jgi:hypothetical protein